jgi:enediyne biosynthesis protein E4
MKIRRIFIACCIAGALSLSAQSFYDVGSATNTQVECNVHGSGFFDFNNDGWDDIYVVHNTSLGAYSNLPNTLLKNMGNGWFTNVSFKAGVEGARRWSAQGLAAADYDNDGDIDMCIAMGSVNHPLFYKNNGDGTFKEASLLTDSNLGYAGRCMAFIDYNNDGFADVLILRNSTPEKAVNPMFLLYQNNRTGGFKDVSQGSNLWQNVPNGDDLYGFALADVNLDGYLDFFVPRPSAPSLLIINNGNGTFSDLTIQYGLDYGQHCTGAVFLDYDNDGDWDLFVKRGSPYTSQLFRNNGNRTFTDVSVESGVNIDFGTRGVDAVFGGGLTAADFDNDGFTDILSLNEYSFNIIYLRNVGDGTFTNATSTSRLTQVSYRWYWTAPAADFNHDGYLDIYMGRSPAKPTYASLYSNKGGTSNWLKLQLTGACRDTPPLQGTNRSGVGARVVAFMGNQKMTRQVQGGDSYKVNSFTVHFGLSGNPSLDSLKVYWPSGIVQTAVDIHANRVISLAEKDTVEYFGDLFIAGAARYSGSDHMISQAVMAMTGDSTKTLLTEVNGAYKFKPINYGTASVTVTPGKPRGEDVEAGVMTSYDAALVLQYVTGLDTLSARQKTGADVNLNGSIDAADAAFIARYAVGIQDDSQSIIGTWVFTPSLRYYSNVVNYFIHQDYLGYIIGDVSENWGNPGGSGKAAVEAVCPSRISVTRDAETVEIPVFVDARSELISADVWIRYDPLRLEFLDASPADLTSGYTLAANEDGGERVKIALYGARPVVEGGEVLKIRFRIRGRDFKQTAIQWEKIAFNEREIRVSETWIGSAERGSGPALMFGLKRNYPNPFNPGTTVDYASDRDGEIRLTVFDMQGRKVRELVRGWRSPGEYKAEWDGKDDQGIDVPTGLYFCRLEVVGRSSVIKMLKTK